MTDTEKYTVDNNPFNEFVLFGWVCSFYSGKTRAYLRKAQVPFREVTVGHPHFGMKIVPPVGRQVVPVIQSREGVIVQDSNEIADFIQANNLGERTLIPPSPVQNITARALEFMVSELFARINLHTRWSHYPEQESFIREQFGSMFGYGSHGDQATRDALADMIRDRATQILPFFGITEDTYQIVDDLYNDVLDALQAHFAEYPYLFGGTETVADCALQGGFQPHLSRDPYPGMIMRHRAPRVLRYSERMAQRDHDMPEYIDVEPGSYIADDALPTTLETLIGVIGKDFLPELKAARAQFDKWADDADIVPGNPLLPEKISRSMGEIEFSVRGKKVYGIAQTNTFWALQRVHDAFDALPEDDQSKVRAKFSALEIEELLDTRPKHRLERRQYTEVWA